MKTTYREIAETLLKQLAEQHRFECIFGTDQMVCIRPMLFNSDGTRQVRQYPDPVEFECIEKATKKLLRNI